MSGYLASVICFSTEKKARLLHRSGPALKHRPLASAWFVFLVGSASAVHAEEPWRPFPPSFSSSDFGGVGLLQTPTARFAPDGQASFNVNHVQPYDRYAITVQGTSWLEATLRLVTVRNRLYSPFPEFSGAQSYKDRGFDVKLRILDEGHIRPAVAFGLRDFIGTGVFSSEYFVLNKSAGPVDISLGLGFGNMASRGQFPNPFRLISGRFADRSGAAVGGSTNLNYFRGREAALFGGIKYDTPIHGVVVKAEYDSNDYKSEALGNRFRVRLPINIGVDYAPRSWARLGVGLERGHKIGLNLTLTTNFNRPFRIPKFDPPATPIEEVAHARPSGTTENAAFAAGAPLGAAANTDLAASPERAPPKIEPLVVLTSPLQPTIPLEPTAEEKKALTDALGNQGAGLYSANFAANEATLYVAQARFRTMPTGLGRIARAAFAALPERYKAINVVFVENGIETISVRVYRDSLIAALTPGRGSVEELLSRTDFAPPPLALDDANYIAPLGKAPPRFYYSIRPTLKTTIGRPEQFILYAAGVRFNGFAQIARGFNAAGSIGVNVSDNFDKLRIPSDSVLPRVRSDIKEYLRQGKTSLVQLNANYSFNIAPSFYGHVYGGLLEEMYGGVGAEILYRPALSNWALGADLTYVKQREFKQRFGFRDYETLTGFMTVARYIPRANVDVRVRLGRYLAKDYGGTFEISRTFDTGMTVGAFVTKTNVSAADFGEGRFDKGIYLSIPLDAIYIRHVRGNVGLTYRPLIRDGGQQVSIPQQLLYTTDDTIRAKFVRDWPGIDD